MKRISTETSPYMSTLPSRVSAISATMLKRKDTESVLVLGLWPLWLIELLSFLSRLW